MPALWVHGHVHRRTDYRVGQNSIVCNARGHADKLIGCNPGSVIGIG